MVKRKRVLALVLLPTFLVTSCAGVFEEGENKREFKGTRTELNQLVVDCLQEDGWEVDLEQHEYDGPQIIFKGDAENEGAFLQAFERCDKKLPNHKYPETEEELKTNFDEFWLPKYECLYQAGFLAEPAPSWETYYEVYRAGKQLARPHYSVPPGQMDAAYEQCPVDADNWQ